MENRFEHFTLDIFNISRYWNRIATEEMKKYGLRGTHALYLLLLDGYEEEITAQPKSQEEQLSFSHPAYELFLLPF